MRALYFDGEKLRLVDNHRLKQGNEVVVKVLLAGICGTDHEMLKGYAGFRGVPGHEFVGVVEEPKSSVFFGKRVVGEINVGCGACEFCVRKLERHCPNRTVLGIKNRDGAFAEYLTLPEKNLHMVPDNVSDTEAVFTEPLAAAYEIFEQTHVDPSSRVAVVGDGRLGTLVAQVLSTVVNQVHVFGKHRRKMDLLQQLGVKCFHVEEPLEPNIYDVVVDASGKASGLSTALKLLKPRGLLILKTTVAEHANINLSPFVVNEITVIGSRCGPFKPALKALARKLVKVDILVDGVYGLEDYMDAFQLAASGNAFKVLLKP